MPEPHAPPQADGIQDPPRTIGATLRRMGPGMILAGSIVGSGELVATTKVGAEAGFTLLWLILIGCAIKVFAQVEIGRYTLAWSRTSLDALNRVPGPRLRVNWIVWGWAAMTLLVLTQQGGIAGGVGQALAISVPLTHSGRESNVLHNELVAACIELAVLGRTGGDDARRETLRLRAESLAGQAASMRDPPDARLWAIMVAIATAIMLYLGRYGFIQAFSTILVAGFTLFTLITVVLLQTRPGWAIEAGDVAEGLSFGLPRPASPDARPVATALAAFGIIGVGAAELIMYPYWCLEKGYARFTGPRDASPQWAQRARGWMRVMQLDAWGSMAVYTFATAAFYLLGAAVLGRAGLNPAGGEMVRTLSQMYVPVFGEWAQPIFLFGAFAVLYSTLFVAAAGNARMVADGLGLMGITARDDATRMRWTRRVSAAWPLLAVLLLLGFREPAQMILASGVAQALMLPALGLAALYFRFRAIDPRLRPGRAWDAMLWLSVAGLFLAGGWTLVSRLGIV